MHTHTHIYSRRGSWYLDRLKQQLYQCPTWWTTCFYWGHLQKYGWAVIHNEQRWLISGSISSLLIKGWLKTAPPKLSSLHRADRSQKIFFCSFGWTVSPSPKLFTFSVFVLFSHNCVGDLKNLPVLPDRWHCLFSKAPGLSLITEANVLIRRECCN